MLELLYLELALQVVQHLHHLLCHRVNHQYPENNNKKTKTNVKHHVAWYMLFIFFKFFFFLHNLCQRPFCGESQPETLIWILNLNKWPKIHVENLQQYQAHQVDLGLPGSRRDPTDRTRQQDTELHCALAAAWTERKDSVSDSNTTMTKFCHPADLQGYPLDRHLQGVLWHRRVQQHQVGRYLPSHPSRLWGPEQEHVKSELCNHGIINAARRDKCVVALLLSASATSIVYNWMNVWSWMVKFFIIWKIFGRYLELWALQKQTWHHFFFKS